MTPEDFSGAMTPIADATAELRGLGHDPNEIGRLFLNGAAVVLHSGCTEAEFLELARQMWATKERQVALAGLLDRVESSSEFRVRFQKKGSRFPTPVASEGSGGPGLGARGSGSRKRPSPIVESVKGDVP